MIAGVVRNDDDRTAGVGLQLLEKIDKSRGIHPAGKGGELHVSARTHGAYQSNAEPIAAVLRFRCLANLAPGGSTVGVRTHRCLIHEIDHRPNSPRLGPQPRKSAVQVFLHLVRVAFVALIDRSLRAQPKMFEKTANATLTHLYPLFLLQQPPDYA